MVFVKTNANLMSFGKRSYKKTNELWVFHLEPNKGHVVGTSALMNMQSRAVHNTGRTMQMNSFNVHSVVDRAWKHLVNVSVGNISELQVHRCMREHAGWKNEHFCTRVLQYFGGKTRKDILSQQFHFGTVESCSAEMISNASLAFKASEVIHPSSCGWCHCALKSYVWFFSLQKVLIYVGDCSFSWGNCRCCWTCAALCITLQSDTRHLGWERLVSPVMRVFTAARSSHFQ